MPPLTKALKELSKVDKRDIAELKALHKPPAGEMYAANFGAIGYSSTTARFVSEVLRNL